MQRKPSYIFWILFLSQTFVNKAEDARFDTSKVCSELQGENVRTSKVQLNDGRAIPRLGFGTVEMKPGAETYGAVYQALNAGYRHIDTAQIYGNEADVGKAVKASGIPRQKIWVTSKLWPDYKYDTDLIIRSGKINNNSSRGYQSARFKALWSLNVTGLEYLDLFLINSPADPDFRVGAWLALQDLQKEGILRSIGVSNYGKHHLEELIQDPRVTVLPAVNQIELHPWKQRKDLVTFCAAHRIAVQAHSPLAKARELTDPILNEVASEVRRTPAQVLIRWSLQQGWIPIPKSAIPSRIAENSKVFDFELEGEQLARLDDLESFMSVTWDPTEDP